MLAALAAAILTQASAQTITYSSVAKPVGEVIVDLAKTLKKSLRVEDQIARQPIIISASDVPAQDLLDRIAKVCYGHWVKDQGIDTLSIDSDAVALAKRNNLIRKEAAISAQISGSMRDMEQASPHTAETALAKVTPGHESFIAFDAGSSTPSCRLLARVLAVIGAREIATVKERMVFSTAPSSTQVQMPGVVDDALASYVDDLAAWKEAKSKSPATNSRHEEPTFSIDQVGKTDVAFQELVSGEIRAELNVLSKSGQKLAVSRGVLSWPIPSPKSQDEKAKNDYEITLSDDAQKVHRSVDATIHLALSDEVRESVKQMVVHDPLSWDQSEILAGFASRQKEQLVAVLPDSYCFNMPTKAAELRRMFAQAPDLSAEEESSGTDWLLIWPNDPDDLFRYRADRAELTRLLAGEKPGSQLPLSDECVYLADNFDSEYCFDWARDILDIQMQTPRQNLAFVGALDPEVLERMKAGNSVQAKDLNDRARSILNRLIYDPKSLESGLVYDKRTDDTSFTDDPTELLPDGVPGDTRISFEDKSTKYVFVKHAWEDKWEAVPPDDLDAILKQVAQHTENAPANDFRIGTLETWDFTFDFGKNAAGSFSIEIDEKLGTDKYTLDTLPDEFKKSTNAGAVQGG